MPPHISYSEIRDLGRCKQKWTYGWWERLAPKVRPIVMDVGDIGHRCMEYYYTGRDWEEAIGKAEEELKQMPNVEDIQLDTFYEASQTVAAIMPNYIEYAERIDPEYIKRILVCEKSYEVLIPGFKETMYRFKVDMIVSSPENGIWLWEHKFVKQAPGGYQHLEYDQQTHSYLWGIREVGYENIEGVVFNLVRHKPTKKEPDQWVIRDRTYRTPAQLDRMSEEIAAAARERLELRRALKTGDTSKVWRYMQWGCLDCVFRQVCIGEHKGIDMTVLRTEQFMIREHHEAVAPPK